MPKKYENRFFRQVKSAIDTVFVRDYRTFVHFSELHRKREVAKHGISFT